MDEERELEGGDPVNSKFDGSVLVGDKFTRVKKINDVTESLVKTEALQNIGDIKSKVSNYFNNLFLLLSSSLALSFRI